MLKMTRRFFYSLLLLLFVGVQQSYSQTDDSGELEEPDFVYLLNADEIRFDQYINPDAQRLIGNVIFRHDSMYLYCDSALFYQDRNSFNAYHNVRVEQGDTLFMYGDSLFYDGTTRFLKVRDNVRLENTSMVLLTDSLNYDREFGLGWFFRGGTLMDGESTLISQYGEFDTNTKLATFIDGVTLESPDYKLWTDTLEYNSGLHEAYLVCPSRIVSDETTINSSRGTFRTDSGSAVLLDRSVVTRESDDAVFTADSIIYEKDDMLISGYGNAVVNDLKDKMDVYGDYVFHDRNIDSALVTGNALVIEYSQEDSLFAHADTFMLQTIYNEAGDSVTDRLVKAYNKVRLFRPDVQAVADSLQYQMSDSSITLYNDPIIWSEHQQILGEKIILYIKDKTVDWADIVGQALYVQEIDTIHYNQMSGREMKAWFKMGELDRTQIQGNVECVFYAQEADSTLVGMNTTTANLMNIYFVQGAVDHIMVEGRSNGIMYPMSQLERNKMYLSTYNWFDFIRPLSREDVFVWRGKRVEQQLKKNAMSKPVPLPKLKK